MAFTPQHLTMDQAAAALEAGHTAIASGETQIDLQKLEHFDSSAVAAIIAWQRAALAKKQGLNITHLPEGLQSLAHLYGVEALMSP